MNKLERRYVVHMNFVFASLTKKQRDMIVDRLEYILDEEFTEDWMMTSTAEPIEDQTNETTK